MGLLGLLGLVWFGLVWFGVLDGGFLVGFVRWFVGCGLLFCFVFGGPGPEIAKKKKRKNRIIS